MLVRLNATFLTFLELIFLYRLSSEIFFFLVVAIGKLVVTSHFYQISPTTAYFCLFMFKTLELQQFSYLVQL